VVSFEGITAAHPWSTKKALIVGLGGLGCPAAMALARAGVGELHLADDDVVAESNLHRQVLFFDTDIGKDKLLAAQDRLLQLGAARVVLHPSRFLPENARELAHGMDVVIEGADNFATKFLAADACYLEKVPVVHGAAVRFVGTALSSAPVGGPCYRCLFEDLLPSDQAPNCSGAGVMGPVVGVVGALLADLALDWLSGDASRAGLMHSFDGKTVQLRTVPISSRLDCPLCGANSQEPIRTLSRELYGAVPIGPAAKKQHKLQHCN
jgi:molybdopterin/thiamine biosynthesis adenylyltransferase